MLGYNAGQFTKESQFGRVSDDFGMDNVRCIGDETSILDCRYTTEEAEDCGGGEGMGVICSGTFETKSDNYLSCQLKTIATSETSQAIIDFHPIQLNPLIAFEHLSL